MSGVGPGTDPSWIGQRVTGDTMLGCGHCQLCLAGKHYVCADRDEIGITDGWPGALAEQMLVAERFAYRIPDNVSVTTAAMVEPGGNSLPRSRSSRPVAGWPPARARLRHDRAARRPDRARPGP